MSNIETVGGHPPAAMPSPPPSREGGASHLLKVASASTQESSHAVAPVQSGDEGQPTRPRGEAARALADRLNRELAKRPEMLNRRMRFNVDETTEELVVQVIDEQTDEVVRQFPPEEVLNRLQDLADLKGVIYSGRG